MIEERDFLTGETMAQQVARDQRNQEEDFSDVTMVICLVVMMGLGWLLTSNWFRRLR